MGLSFQCEEDIRKTRLAWLHKVHYKADPEQTPGHGKVAICAPGRLSLDSIHVLLLFLGIRSCDKVRAQESWTSLNA